MTASQRRHLYSGLMLGIAVTLFVTVLDAMGVLSGVENYLYKQRALRCQLFTPHPTTQLVHLDIDDESLEEIGVLPWPRTLLADVIDELRLLHAKVIVLDIILPDPQTQPGGIDHDANLAAAIARHGKVLVPLSLTFGKQPDRSPQWRWLVAEFLKDLETPLPTMHDHALAKWGDVPANDLITAREEAARQAVSREAATATTGHWSADELGQRLLPKSWGVEGAGSEKLKDTLRAYAMQEESRRTIRQLARPGEAVGQMIRATGDLPPIPILARAAGYTGFVDHLPFDDGVVRAVPTWVEYRGTLFPFMGLRMACAMLDVPLDRVRIEPTQVVIPKNDGTEVILPSITYPSAKLGQDVGLLMRVPWFGTNAWETMYDYPAHREAKQHVPFGLLWQAVKARRAAVRNNQVVDRALQQLVKQSDSDEAKKFLKAAVPIDDVEHRIAVTTTVLKEFDDLGWVAEFRKMTPDELKKDDNSRSWLAAYDALVASRQANQQAINEEQKLRREFDGRAVLVGSVASGAADFVTTPLHGQCPGAVVHGAVFNAVMTGFIWRDVPGWVNMAATIAVGLLVTFAVAWLSPLAAAGAMALVVASYLGINGYLVFDWGKHIMGAAGPVVAAGGVWGVVTVTRYIVERAEGERVRGRFRSYVDEQLVDYVLENPGRDIFEGEEHERFFAYADMKGFTSLMERLGKRIVPVLNEYMGRMVPIIQDNGGYVNKYLGDGIMFFYGAPRPNHDHAADAVATVLEMQVAIAKFNAWLEEQGLDHVAVRAGVTTGFVVVGDAGSKKRADYTVLGDSVNLASRLESANKYFGTAVMISERTHELLDNRFVVRPIGRIRVVGKTAWVMAYEPIARAGAETDQQRDLAAATSRMVDAFIAGQFADCHAAAEDAIARFGPQRLFEMYLALARHNHEHGPADGFDGVVELSEK